RTSASLDPTPVVWQPRSKFQDRVWLHVLLFVLTLMTTTVIGAFHYAGFLDDFRQSPTLPMPFPALLVRGFWYSGTILAILRCHRRGPLLLSPLLRRGCAAAVFSAAPATVPDRHARRGHSHPRAAPEQECAVRHRDRGPHRRFSRHASRAVLRRRDVARRPAA